MSFPNRLLLYLFPIPLWIVEYLLRLAAGQGREAAEFFTPSLAAAAVGISLPVCIPKTFPTEKFEEMTGIRLARGYVIRTRFDADLVPFGWISESHADLAWRL